MSALGGGGSDLGVLLSGTVGAVIGSATSSFLTGLKDRRERRRLEMEKNEARMVTLEQICVRLTQQLSDLQTASGPLPRSRQGP